MALFSGVRGVKAGQPTLQLIASPGGGGTKGTPAVQGTGAYCKMEGPWMSCARFSRLLHVPAVSDAFRTRTARAYTW